MNEWEKQSVTQNFWLPWVRHNDTYLYGNSIVFKELTQLRVKVWSFPAFAWIVFNAHAPNWLTSTTCMKIDTLYWLAPYLIICLAEPV